MEPRVRMTREEIVRSARTLRGALIDIDHALTDPKTQLRLEYYYEKYGLRTLGPVGQVLDAEAEENSEVGGLAVEAVASIWDPAVYRLIEAGAFKGCSVVQKYRSERCVQSPQYVCDAVGVSYPLVSLVLEGEPAFPKTLVRPLRIDRVGTGRLQELTMPTKIPGISVHYSYSPCSGYGRRLVETCQAALLKNVKPTGIVEASPVSEAQSQCDHSSFIESLNSLDLGTLPMVPNQVYFSLLNAALAETSHCEHHDLVSAWVMPTAMAHISSKRFSSFVSWLRDSLSSPRPLCSVKRLERGDVDGG